MNIRTKFVIVIVSIITLPIVVVAIVGYIYMTYDMTSDEIPMFIDAHKIIEEELPKLSASGNLEQVLKKIPQHIRVFYLDDSGTISFSNFSAFRAGDVLPYDDLQKSVFAERYRKDTIIIEPIELSPYKAGRLVWFTTLLQEHPPKGPRFYLIFLLAMLVVGAFFSTAFISSFRSSLFDLEEATRRVSSGDLDFELVPHGNDEISSLTRSFEIMRRSLREENEKRSRFLMAVSHDLSTPLTSIRGYIEAIEDGLAQSPQDLKKYLDIMMEKSKVLEGRIGKLIEFVQMGTDEWKMTQEPVRLKDFLIDISRVYKEDAIILKRKFSYSIDIPEDISLYIDKGLLSRAFENLFSNAARYTREGDSIEMNAISRGDHIDVILRDTGYGIPKEDMDKLFDPFWYGKRFTKQRGFGVGLSIVKTILDTHGWSIEVSSEIGKGTSFFIHIPHTPASRTV